MGGGVGGHLGGWGGRMMGGLVCWYVSWCSVCRLLYCGL